MHMRRAVRQVESRIISRWYLHIPKGRAILYCTHHHEGKSVVCDVTCELITMLTIHLTGGVRDGKVSKVGSRRRCVR